MSVKSKDKKSIRYALKLVPTSANLCKPERLQTDQGTELFNRKITGLMSTNGIHYFESESDQKSAEVERFNRILKSGYGLT